MMNNKTRGGTGGNEKDGYCWSDMIFRFFIFLVGFGLSVAGGVTLILELNFIIIGHTVLEYFQYISRRPELFLFASGIVVIWLSVYWPRF
ncbi:hypothetical protein [Guptibacillus algicola]|uniref:hypothetical protein n=1 Tax=Guptibacillus algicola TaxID=225844 RepID=UPI001CD22E2D|nr:hypothetical protein [Alkalihalobacillus algicola]MCA0987703.1 hypothetical protein [Alkalihalobacillus algicola]